MEKTCCFTGHRPDALPWGDDETCADFTEFYAVFHKKVVQLIREENVVHFISGMAQGIDLIAAETVLKLKNVFPEITLECAVPYPDQAKSWKEGYKLRYDEVLKQADKVTFVSENYSHYCMMKRNQYMVEHADIVLAVYNGRAGGTRNTLLYASKRERQIEIIEIEI